ncbi:MAG: J domain-containing protein, partial [Syntrophaceae bacterium]
MIRESYRDQNGYRYRDLFELGPEPEAYIVYPGGNAFYMDEVVEDNIRFSRGSQDCFGEVGCRGNDPGVEDLEGIFWPFLRPDIQIKVEPSPRRERRSACSRSSPAKTAALDAHIFDKRRIHFLRTGRMAPRSLDRLPQSALRGLQCKSRDEIEQGFMVTESVLRPREYKAYVYAIFNLQRFFVQHSGKENPEFLGQDEVDAFFIEEICRLNRDADFWAGMDTGDRLNDYLIRYLVMYFDHSYAPHSPAADYIWGFMNRHRAYRPPEAVSVSMQEIAA